MKNCNRTGNRKSREQFYRKRVPSLGYYFIVTDTKETEQNYMFGLRDSIPKELQGKLVIKVKKTSTSNLVEEAKNMASLHPQYGEIWIIFDRDQVANFDEIIHEARRQGIQVGWTNPCIEEWFSAYFGVMPLHSDSVSCCDKFSRLYLLRTHQQYAKSDAKIYDKLNRFGDERQAIKLADKKLREHIADGKNKPSEQNPGTTVHILVNEIKAKIQR